ncbi:hypothetical protein IM45_165 [Candidatus Palibaumannia cicadellinicola]|uniref:Uncharacterized protein n=1 Tax=Candidatus Palibaumannia cicadellinicola TaxID=186490 RepID=A0A088N9Z7_9GAMM|nr:hypothetical protein IM45_165 [Candidatus Baumannia cicadellinicola]
MVKYQHSKFYFENLFLNNISIDDYFTFTDILKEYTYT